MFLFVGSDDDKRNILYKKTLNKVAKFDYKLIDWNSFISKSSKMKNVNPIRLSSPFFEKKLQNQLQFPEQKKINKNYLSILNLASNKYNSTFINSPKSISIMRDKYQTSQHLEKENIPSPYVHKNKSFDEIYELVKEKPLFIKPTSGSLGRNLGIFEMKKESYTFTSQEENSLQILKDKEAIKYVKKLNNNKEFLFQDYIKTPSINNTKFDVRMLYILGDIPFSYARYADPSLIGTNVTKGAGMSIDYLLKIPSNKLELAKQYVTKTCKTLNTGIAGVDVIFDEEFNPYILEVNAFPGIQGPTKFNFNPYEYEIKKLNEEFI
jgi:glutathione synthase/RimK-type ligase-like ATP-grasp enzyme